MRPSSLPRAAARSASLPRSRGCARCTTASPRCSKPAASCCWPSMSRRCRPRRWSTSFAPRRIRCLLGTDAIRDGVDVPGRSLAPSGVRPGAVAAPGHPAPRPQAGVRRRPIFRPDRPAAAAPGLWPAHSPRRRSRRLRDPRSRAPVAAAVGLSRPCRRRASAAGRGGGADRAVSRHAAIRLDRCRPVLVCQPRRRKGS